MTRRRWIADEVAGDRATLIGSHADHLARVLRARVGQEFDIATGEGVRRGRIVAIAGDRIDFELGEEVCGSNLAEITLLLAIFKFDRMEWAIEKCTELGVWRIVPVIARRTDSHLARASGKRVDRWQRIARQAAEQSRRGQPPEILAPVKLSEAFSAPAGLRIVLAESVEQTSLSQIVNQQHDPLRAGAGIALAIGPEGGWTESELKLLRDARWISASLGRTILRAETAAIAATAVVVSALQSL